MSLLVVRAGDLEVCVMREATVANGVKPAIVAAVMNTVAIMVAEDTAMKKKADMDVIV